MQPGPGEELRFDAHEFDGLREDFANATADTVLRSAERFIKENRWLCLGLAAAAGVALVYAILQGKVHGKVAGKS